METGSKAEAAPMEMQKMLKGINYPAKRSDIIGQAKKSGAMNVVLLQKLGMLQDKEYASAEEVLKELEKR